MAYRIHSQPIMAIATAARYIALENGARRRRKTAMRQPLCLNRNFSSCRAIWGSSARVTDNAFPMNEWCEACNLRLDLTLWFKVKGPPEPQRVKARSDAVRQASTGSIISRGDRRLCPGLPGGAGQPQARLCSIWLRRPKARRLRLRAVNTRQDALGTASSVLMSSSLTPLSGAKIFINKTTLPHRNRPRGAH
jgi:hypothetical protein